MRILLGTKVIDLHEKRPTDDGHGHRNVRVGAEEVSLACEVDEALLKALLGERAARNKSGTAQLGQGTIKVVVTHRRRIE